MATKIDWTDPKVLARWRKVKRRAFSRDRGCVICGKRKGTHSHHLADKSTYPSLAFKTSNVVTLCKYHHTLFHVRYMGGYHKSCTPQDFERYKHWLRSRAILEYLVPMFYGTIIILSLIIGVLLWL